MPIKWIYQVSMVLVLHSMLMISISFMSNDLRTNLFKKRGNDAIEATSKDLLEVPNGPMTRFKAKTFIESFIRLLLDTWAKVDFKRVINNEELPLLVEPRPLHKDWDSKTQIG